MTAISSETLRQARLALERRVAGRPVPVFDGPTWIYPRRGFRRRVERDRPSLAYAVDRRRPGRRSRWADRELRAADLDAASVLPADLLEELHLSPVDRRVLSALVVLARGRSAVVAFAAKVANIARCSRSGYQLAVRHLENAGVLRRHEQRVERDRNGPNVFELLDARLLPAADEREVFESRGEGPNFSAAPYSVDSFSIGRTIRPIRKSVPTRADLPSG
jgi:predicted transcriptional regulator